MAAAPLLIRETPPQFLEWKGFSFFLSRLEGAFLLPVLILIPLCAFHAADSIRRNNKGCFWFFFNLLCACAVVTPLAHMGNGPEFLLFWEIMELAGLALILFQRHGNMSGRTARVYLLSGYAGMLFLIPMFILLNCFQYTAYPISAIIFLLAVLGFGLKAGLPFLHFGLYEA